MPGDFLIVILRIIVVDIRQEKDFYASEKRREIPLVGTIETATLNCYGSKNKKTRESW